MIRRAWFWAKLGVGLTIAALQSLACERPEPCSPEALAALQAANETAAMKLLDSGACDAYERVEHCPAYLAFEAGVAPAYAELRRCAK